MSYQRITDTLLAEYKRKQKASGKVLLKDDLVYIRCADLEDLIEQANNGDLKHLDKDGLIWAYEMAVGTAEKQLTDNKASLDLLRLQVANGGFIRKDIHESELQKEKDEQERLKKEIKSLKEEVEKYKSYIDDVKSGKYDDKEEYWQR